LQQEVGGGVDDDDQSFECRRRARKLPEWGPHRESSGGEFVGLDSSETEGVEIGRAVRPRGTTLFLEPCPPLEPLWEDIAVDKTLVAAHMPRGAVWAVAAAFLECVRRVFHEGTWESLHELCCLQRWCLRPRGEQARGNGQSLASRWLRGRNNSTGVMWARCRVRHG